MLKKKNAVPINFLPALGVYILIQLLQPEGGRICKYSGNDGEVHVDDRRAVGRHSIVAAVSVKPVVDM